MLVLLDRRAGSKPGRWFTNPVVLEGVDGKGVRTTSEARSVSAKYPPSMCG